MSKLSTIIASFLVAVGIAASGFFIKVGLDHFHKPTGSVNVKGLVEVPVKSDYVVWQINYSDEGNDLQQAVEKAKLSKEAINRFLVKYGLAAYSRPTLPNVERREDPDKTTKIVVKSGFVISCADVDKVDAAYSESSSLLNDNVNLVDPWGTRPRYIYKKFNERRPELFSIAVKNAQEMAEKFAKDSNVKLGKIMSADQGTFEILALNQGEADFSKDKIIRVVSRFTYSIL